jgi:cytochrome b subunit of formate dehydrogenase
MSTYVAFLTAVLTIASASIGIQCINADTKQSEGTKRNKKFLVYMLIAAILVLILSGVMIFASSKKKMVVVETNSTNIARGNFNASMVRKGA